MNYNPEEYEYESDYIISVLDKIIDESLERFKQSNDFKVRPGYSYDRFFLNRVEGCYDESLYGLIHHIMFKDGVYKELFTDEQYELCEKLVEETPELIWYPLDEDEDYERVQDMLDEIYNCSISHVCEGLKNEGFEIEEHQYYMELRGGY